MFSPPGGVSSASGRLWRKCWRGSRWFWIQPVPPLRPPPPAVPPLQWWSLSLWCRSRSPSWHETCRGWRSTPDLPWSEPEPPGTPGTHGPGPGPDRLETEQEQKSYCWKHFSKIIKTSAQSGSAVWQIMSERSRPTGKKRNVWNQFIWRSWDVF